MQPEDSAGWDILLLPLAKDVLHARRTIFFAERAAAFERKHYQQLQPIAWFTSLDIEA
jgi:hypothetical protein